MILAFLYADICTYIVYIYIHPHTILPALLRQSNNMFFRQHPQQQQQNKSALGSLAKAHRLGRCPLQQQLPQMTVGSILGPHGPLVKGLSLQGGLMQHTFTGHFKRPPSQNGGYLGSGLDPGMSPKAPQEAASPLKLPPIVRSP